jgi:hypothetical protein
MYLDLYITSSPLTICGDVNPSLKTRDGFYRIRNGRDTKNFLYIDSKVKSNLIIYFHI